MKTVYTYIFNNYDTLKQPIKTKGWKYICFTDNPDLYEKGIWQLEKVPIIDNPKKTSSYYLTHGLELFGDIILSVSGQCQIIGNLNYFIEKFLIRDYCIMRHAKRICTYSEGRAVMKHKRDISGNVITQMARYEKEGLPEDSGMVQCAVIGRRNTSEIKKFETLWWDELNKETLREQLSFNYVLWKNPIKVNYFDSEDLKRYIIIHEHLKE